MLVENYRRCGSVWKCCNPGGKNSKRRAEKDVIAGGMSVGGSKAVPQIKTTQMWHNSVIQLEQTQSCLY